MVRLYDVEVSGNRLVEKNLVFLGTQQNCRRSSS